MARFLARVGCLSLALGIAAMVALVALTAVWRVAPPVSTLMLARYVTGRPVVRDYARDLLAELLDPLHGVRGEHQVGRRYH